MNKSRFGWYLAILLVQPAWVSAGDDLMTSQIVDEARTWQHRGREDLAADAWQRLLVTNPQHGEALVSLGLIMAKSGELTQAKALYARARRAKVPSSAMSKLASAVGEVNDDALVSAVQSKKSAAQKSKKTSTEKSNEKSVAKTIVSPPSAKRENASSAAAAEPVVVKITPLPSPQIDTRVEPKLDPGQPQEPSSSSKTSSPKPRPVKPLPYFSDL
jgi:hypothetical protein